MLFRLDGCISNTYMVYQSLAPLCLPTIKIMLLFEGKKGAHHANEEIKIEEKTVEG